MVLCPRLRIPLGCLCQDASIAQSDVSLPQRSFASLLLYITKLLHSGKLTSLLAIMALKVFSHVEANRAVTSGYNEANGLIAVL